MTQSLFELAHELRRQAPPATAALQGAQRRAEHFLSHGLDWPTAKSEGFSHRGLEELRSNPWTLPNEAALGEPALSEAREIVAAAGWDGPQVVFVNGAPAPMLWRDCQVPGLALDPLAQFGPHTTGPSAQALAQLGTLGLHTDEAYAALNTASLGDGVLVSVAPHSRIEQPIALVFVTTSHAAGAIVQPRSLIVLGASSEATFFERHLGAEHGAQFSNAVTEIILDTGAQAKGVLEQTLGAGALHTGTVGLRIGKDALCQLTTFDVGARLSRRSVRAELLAPGAEARLWHAALCRGSQHAATRATVRHVSGTTQSHQHFRAVADAGGSASFSGCVHILPQAPKANAEQMSRGLLLSPSSRISLRPQLMIFTDDVKCRHGATVGALDDEALFYLMSRGLAEKRARELLTLAFLRDSLTNVPVAIAPLFDAHVTRWLGLGDVPRAHADVASL